MRQGKRKTEQTLAQANSQSLNWGYSTSLNEKPNDKEIIEEECNGVTDTLMRAVGTDWRELDETVKSSVAKAVQDQFKSYWRNMRKR